MKTFLILLAILAISAGIAVSDTPVFAATLEWDRNSELDANHYNIYKCQVAGCTVEKIATQKSSITVAQPAVGVKPTANQTITEGALAVTCVDNAGNESALSNQVVWPVPVPDTSAPMPPTGLTVR